MGRKEDEGRTIELGEGASLQGVATGNQTQLQVTAPGYDALSKKKLSPDSRPEISCFVCSIVRHGRQELELHANAQCITRASTRLPRCP